MGEWLDAWQAWASGDDISGREIWGISVLWWGRIGMIAQVLAALTIIAEIVGAHRIRAFGTALRERPDTVGPRTLRDGWNWAKAMWAYYMSPWGSEKEKKAEARSETFRTNYLFSIAAIGLFAFGMYVTWGFGWSWWVWLLSAVPMVGIASLLAAPLAVLIVVVAGGFALFAEYLLKPVAWVLEREKPDLWIKGGSIVVLIVGFQLDLLAN